MTRNNNIPIEERKLFSFTENDEKFRITMCMDCGQKMTHVRPGKYQCDNTDCWRNE